jgi:hypothetical protein
MSLFSIQLSAYTLPLYVDMGGRLEDVHADLGRKQQVALEEAAGGVPYL